MFRRPSLAALLGDGDVLSAKLEREPLVVKPSSVAWAGVVAGLFAGVLAALGAEKLWDGSGDFVFPAVFVLIVAASLMPRSWLRFGPESFEVVKGNAVVRVPYLSVDAGGAPLVKTLNGVDQSIVIPLVLGGVDRIERIRSPRTPEQAVLSHGRAAVSSALRFPSDAQLELLGSYRVRLEEIGHLVFRLASEQRARTTSAPAAVAAPRPQSDPDGWFTFPSPNVPLPSLCCECFKPTDEASTFTGSARWLGLLTLGHFTRTSSLLVPHCGACRAALEKRDRRRRLLGAALGATFGVALGLALLALLRTPTSDETLALLAATVLGLVSAALGWAFGGTFQTVVDVRPALTGNAIRVRFGNPEYARKVAGG